MTFVPRLLAVALSTYGIAALLGSAALILWWRRVPSADADGLFRWRLAPAAAAGVSSLAMAVVFVLFEPRAGVERTPFVLMTLATAAVVIVAAAVVKAAVSHSRTRAGLRDWTASAESTVLPDVGVPSLVVDSHFPIVAVVGILRPRLIVARSVLSACSPDEWRAIAAHETWHVQRRDNARRALLAAAPDALIGLSFARRATRQWNDAAEAAADSAAIRGFPAGRLSLASALVRVARLVPRGQRPASIPATALYRGEGLDVRLRRILEGPAAPPPVRAPAQRLIVVAALIAVTTLALHPLYELLESAVSYLP